MKVARIDKAVAERVVREKHYKGTLGVFWEGFALIHDGRLVGVACYGQPSPPIQKHAFFERDFRLYELTRLVMDRDVKNGASFLIANSLQQLNARPCAVVSYADSAAGHVGIVYQATNWIYTGAVKAHDKLYKVGGEILHPVTVRDRFGVTSPAKWAKENEIEVIPPMLKHRYFQIVGPKGFRRAALSKLRYPAVLAYPKADKTLYEDGPACMACVGLETT